MAAKVVWTAEAIEDVQAIADFIGRDSPQHARRIVELLYEQGDLIAQLPQAGRIVPELGNPRVRERFVFSYRVIYEIGAVDIDILTVLHGRRLIESVDGGPA